MKPTFLLLLLIVGGYGQTTSSVQFFGDRALRQAYPIDCWYGSAVSSSNWITFTDMNAIGQQGYNLVPCPPRPAPDQLADVQKPSKNKTDKPRRESLTKVLAITSEPQAYLGKTVTVEADINVSDKFSYGEQTYSFRVSDGSAGFYIYMNRAAAQPLRDAIMSQPKSGSIHGQFTFYLDPEAYKSLNQLCGRMISYQASGK